MKSVLVYEKSLSFKFLKSSSFCPTDEKVIKSHIFYLLYLESNHEICHYK